LPILSTTALLNIVLSNAMLSNIIALNVIVLSTLHSNIREAKTKMPTRGWHFLTFKR
jgi:hypothetical protein